MSPRWNRGVGSALVLALELRQRLMCVLVLARVRVLVLGVALVMVPLLALILVLRPALVLQLVLALVLVLGQVLGLKHLRMEFGLDQLLRLEVVSRERPRILNSQSLRSQTLRRQRHLEWPSQA